MDLMLGLIVIRKSKQNTFHNFELLFATSSRLNKFTFDFFRR